ncbi:MAG: HU family DNA-binding protein, partial [Muribaculaceae bacterium]|nr:HU family DNA-binding protein [Muribaculaceae bacterium]
MNSKITLVELARLMAESTSTTSRMCELFLRELFTTVSQALINGESVKIKGIGTFKVTPVKPRKSVNVTTGDPMEIKGYNKVTFTPDKKLAEAVNQPFAQFETVFINDAVSDEKLAEIDARYPSA